jgi:hypothetical protein
MLHEPEQSVVEFGFLIRLPFLMPPDAGVLRKAAEVAVLRLAVGQVERRSNPR